MIDIITAIGLNGLGLHRVLTHMGPSNAQRLGEAVGLSEQTTRDTLDRLLAHRMVEVSRYQRPYTYTALERPLPDVERDIAEGNVDEDVERARFRARDGHGTDSELETRFCDHLDHHRIPHIIHVPMSTLIRGWDGDPRANVDFQVTTRAGTPQKLVFEVFSSDRAVAKAERLRQEGVKVIIITNDNLYNAVDYALLASKLQGQSSEPNELPGYDRAVRKPTDVKPSEHIWSQFERDQRREREEREAAAEGESDPTSEEAGIVVPFYEPEAIAYGLRKFPTLTKEECQSYIMRISNEQEVDEPETEGPTGTFLNQEEGEDA